MLQSEVQTVIFVTLALTGGRRGVTGQEGQRPYPGGGESAFDESTLHCNILCDMYM
jgi:hypothetical protein